MKPPVKILVIYVAETDLWGTGSLYEAIVRRLRHLGLAGPPRRWA
jgi:PII-like signaling protein